MKLLPAAASSLSMNLTVAAGSDVGGERDAHRKRPSSTASIPKRFERRDRP
jgi:hypothetical protein